MTARFALVVCLAGSTACLGHPPLAPLDPGGSHLTPRPERPAGPAARETPTGAPPAAASTQPTPADTKEVSEASDKRPATPATVTGAPKTSEASKPSDMTKAPPATEPTQVPPRGPIVPVVPNGMPEPSPL